QEVNILPSRSFHVLCLMDSICGILSVVGILSVKSSKRSR
ncbi:Uncharacterized protein BM_BM13173, partial [Brugia malayi]